MTDANPGAKRDHKEYPISFAGLLTYREVARGGVEVEDVLRGDTPDSHVAEFAEGEVNAYVQGYQPRMASFEDTLFTQVEGAVVVHNIGASILGRKFVRTQAVRKT